MSHQAQWSEEPRPDMKEVAPGLGLTSDSQDWASSLAARIGPHLWQPGRLQADRQPEDRGKELGAQAMSRQWKLAPSLLKTWVFKVVFPFLLLFIFSICFMNQRYEILKYKYLFTLQEFKVP